MLKVIYFPQLAMGLRTPTSYGWSVVNELDIFNLQKQNKHISGLLFNLKNYVADIIAI
jgi:hypothetical protein